MAKTKIPHYYSPVSSEPPAIRRGNVRRAMRAVGQKEGIHNGLIRFQPKVMAPGDLSRMIGFQIPGDYHPVFGARERKSGDTYITTNLSGMGLHDPRTGKDAFPLSIGAHEMAHGKGVKGKEEGPMHQRVWTGLEKKVYREARKLAEKDRSYLARKSSSPLVDSGWDESKHPRVPAGSSDGGQFTDK